MKIKTGKDHRKGAECITSVGKIQFDEQGIAEINDDQFAELKLLMPDVTEYKPKGDASKGSTDEGGEKTEEEVRVELKVMTVADLKAMAEKVPGVDLVALEEMKTKLPIIDIIVEEMFKEEGE